MKKSLSPERKAAAHIANLRRIGAFQEIGVAFLDEQIAVLEKTCATLRHGQMKKRSSSQANVASKLAFRSRE
jgi:hypothetical protein